MPVDGDAELPPRKLATLVLLYDEASPNLAAYCRTAYRARLRVLGVPDIFYREWNGVALVLKGCKVWYCILYQVHRFKLPYGP